jgi:acetyl-CoA C-acetyltransferase
MSESRVFVLGGYQTDFSRNWAREESELFDMICVAFEGAIAATDIAPGEIETVHVGNFAAELFCSQGQIGGFVPSLHPDLDGIPTARHEAACASGSIAALAAASEIEAGRYGLACLIGVEMMRNVPGDIATRHLGAARWVGKEADDARYVWPHLFNELGEEYDRRYGLRYQHLAAIARNNFENARRNPNAQSRNWRFTEESFSEDDDANPVIDGRIRRQDCGQVTDGAAVVFLASEEYAARYAARRGVDVSAIPIIEGWGHRTAPMRLADKLDRSRNSPYILPHVRGTVEDAFRRAGIGGVADVDGLEVHDCFSTTEYMAIDHFGITAPGESWKAVEDGSIAMGGRIPVNASGGLIGLGHPVGATGVRMLLDCAKQVTDTAGDYQIDGARRMATLNVGGSATTTVSFVVGRLT